MNSGKPHCSQVARDVLDIWEAGVHAVKPETVVSRKIRIDGDYLFIDSEQIKLSEVSRFVVVGAGKASAAMARSLVDVLRQAANTVPPVVGWVNCPEGTAKQNSAESHHSNQDSNEADLLTLGRNIAGEGVRIFEARPMGVNAPTEKAVHGTKEILKLVAGAKPTDVVICLISGGGSALLVAPSAGVALQDKQAVARLVAAAGADIEQLNGLRRCLSDVKGGGLARHCNARRLYAVLISDVLGDPLRTIASGPCVLDQQPDFRGALDMLRQLGIDGDPRLTAVVSHLKEKQGCVAEQRKTLPSVQHVVLANNADAVDAAGVRAVELGYQYIMQAATSAEGDVERVAEQALRVAKQLLTKPGFDCWISGGEPSVTLPAEPGKGGRNQHLALRVLDGLIESGWPLSAELPGDFAFVSGGTDGEDGPTDAAGAWFDQSVFRESQQLGIQRQPYLNGADAYGYFERTGGLLRTGPTGTNVCDLRVALVRR